MTPARPAPRRDQRGFTILETLVAMTVFLALLTAVLSVYTPSRALYARGERRVDAQQNARLAMAEMVRQIRMAGYFPENHTVTPPTPRVADRLLLGTDGAIAVHGDADNNGNSQAVFFCLDGTTLRRSTGARTATASYTCNTGDVMAENVTTLRFTYYDVAGAPLPAPPSAPYQLDSVASTGAVPDFTDMTQRGTIRRVVITLTVEWESPQRGPSNYSLTSDVWLRNG